MESHIRDQDEASSPIIADTRMLIAALSLRGEWIDNSLETDYHSPVLYGSMTRKEAHMGVSKLSKVQEKGQVTIPVEIRRKWNLEKGDLVAFVETEQGVMISPREVVAVEALDRVGEALKERGINLEELIEGGREIRGQLLEEEYDIKVDDE